MKTSFKNSFVYCIYKLDIMKKLLLLLLLVTMVSCSKDSPLPEPTPTITYTLTATAAEGGTVNTTGGTYQSGDSVQVTATPNDEYVFSGWSNGSTDNPLIVVVSSNQTISANFIKVTYSLTTTTEGEGTITETIVSSGKSTDYNSGSVVRLTAVPSSGWGFNGWTGDYVGVENPLEVDVTQAKSFNAVFEALPSIYLDENGVTIKAYDSAVVGEVYELGVDSYTVVDNELLTLMIANGDDVSKVVTTKLTTMYQMFLASSFNQDIGSWDTSNVYDWTGMFYLASSFNQDISNWDTSNASDMRGVFNGASSFNQNIGGWNTSSVTLMNDMFNDATAFNQDLSGWCVSNITSEPTSFATNSALTEANKPLWGTCPEGTNTDTTASIYFENSTCKCPLATLGDTADINGVTYTTVDNSTIAGQIANGNVNLCTTLVTDMIELFEYNASFNSDIGFWDTSNVTDMGYMFSNAQVFNQDIGSWDTSNVTDMVAMFFSAESFNQDISSWNTSKVTDMSYMLSGTAFNQDIGNWITSSVTEMNGMFSEAASFNQNIGSWDTSSVTNMVYMFSEATAFNQNLTGWCVSNVTSEPEIFAQDSALTEDNKPIWGTCPDYNINVTASSNSDYTLAGSDRNGAVSGNDPSITINVGDEVNFIVNAASHPFYIKTVQGTGTDNQVSNVTNNGATSGVVNWTPTAAGTYYYQCSAHDGMYGTITVQ